MHALRNIHAALVPEGLLADTQPLSPHPRVAAGDDELGTLDMRAWVDTIRAVDERFAEAFAGGLYTLQDEVHFVVSDSFGSGLECLETVISWRDTRVPPALASRLKATQAAVSVEQEVRLRLLSRAMPTHHSRLIA